MLPAPCPFALRPFAPSPFAPSPLLFALCPLPFTISAVDRQTQREFLIDIEELVEQLFADTERLRRQDAQGPLRRELLDSIFRHVHSIKGVSATAGLTSVSDLAHQTENLLEGARSGRIALDAAFVELLEESANAISESLSAVAAATVPKPDTALLQKIQDWTRRDVLQDTSLPLPDLPADFSSSLNDDEKQALLLALQQNEKLYLINADFPLAIFEQEFSRLRTFLARQGAVISSLPSANSLHPHRVSFRILYASDLSLLQLQEPLAAFPQVVIIGVPSYGSAADPLELSQPERVASGPAPASFVRIGIEELDRLIASAHELFGQTVLALDLVSDQLAAESQSELKNLDAQIRESLLSLEEKIIQLRMVPLERVMQRAVRAGRVAARVGGKEVEISIGGSHLRIDKLTCDAIADPLLHLVRNAVDQGIELPEERVKAGKSPSGHVRVEAAAAGGRVRVLVTDDGRGIDPLIVSQAATNQGLIKEGTILSSEKCLRLLFRAGFSTAATVSDVSGRGVGLNVVEREIERVGGAVHVRTQVGRGSEFEIRLPATLGVLRALVVVSGGHRYCLDSRQIVDRCGPAETDLRAQAAEQVFLWHNKTLPAIDLHHLLEQSATAATPNSQVLVCDLPAESKDGPGEQISRHAILIEGVEGNQEVLVRGLGRHAALWPGVAGAAELWNGTVALVLDLPQLLSRSQIASSVQD